MNLSSTASNLLRNKSGTVLILNRDINSIVSIARASGGKHTTAKDCLIINNKLHDVTYIKCARWLDATLRTENQSNGEGLSYILIFKSLDFAIVGIIMFLTQTRLRCKNNKPSSQSGRGTGSLCRGHTVL